MNFDFFYHYDSLHYFFFWNIQWMKIKYETKQWNRKEEEEGEERPQADRNAEILNGIILDSRFYVLDS